MRCLFVVQLLLLLGLAATGHAQQYRTLKVYQYEGTDSAHRALALERTFDAQGRLTAEVYHQEYSEDGTSFYWSGTARFWEYQDTMLIRCYGTGMLRGDSIRAHYTHNGQGQRTAMQVFRYYRKLKPGVDKGLTRPGGCIMEDSDYESARTWQRGTFNTFRYDAQGRCVEHTAVEPSGTTAWEQWQYDRRGRRTRYSWAEKDSIRNRTKYWRYNWRGRLREHQEHDRDGLTTQTFYRYDWRGRLRDRVSYAADSTLAGDDYYTYRRGLVLRTGRYRSYPGGDSLYDDHHVRLLNRKGQLVEEVSVAGRCELQTKRLIRYYPDGKVARTVLLTCRDNRRVVHDYVYQ